MSTFPGPLNEFPGVSIDCFTEENRQSFVFFLSHCHLDHMKGLDEEKDLPGPLYASEISAVILKKKYPYLKDIRTLEIGVETEIVIEDGRSVCVTTIPAGHCPGSVMFLFESAHCRVLYTGDFRLRDKDMKNMRILERIRGKLDNLYIDSTFLSRIYEEFPSRMDSTDTIIGLIDEWISKSSNHTIWIRTTAHYGSEYLFKEINRRTGKSVHIDPGNLSNYIHIPDMDGIFTVHGDQTQIHACWNPGCYVLRDQNKEIRTIRPTAMFWTKWKPSCDIVRSTGNTFRVCYSSHSSFRELKDFIDYLKPQKVELNVVPAKAEDRAEMYSILRKMVLGDKPEVPENGEKEEFEKISFKNINFRTIGLEEKLSEEFDNDFHYIPKRKKL